MIDSLGWGEGRVSVVVPVFNAERHLGDALASIARQSVRPAEVFFIDDGSTDNCRRAVEEAGIDCEYGRQENAGPAAGRNAGLMRASSMSWPSSMRMMSGRPRSSRPSCGAFMSGPRSTSWLDRSSGFKARCHPTRSLVILWSRTTSARLYFVDACSMLLASSTRLFDSARTWIGSIERGSWA